VYWTSDPYQLQQRRLLGITWEELPSVGFNTLDHQAFAYPRHYGFDRETVEKWIKDLSRGKAGGHSKQTYSAQESDQTIYQYFLDETIPADRQRLE